MIPKTFPCPNFSLEAINAAKQKAVEAYPKESCGLIVAGEYVHCENTAEDPEKDFRIDPRYIIEAGGALEAVIHSHPHPKLEAISPSAVDHRGQMDSGVIWGIIPCNDLEAKDPVFWGDFRLEEEMLGQNFIHGVVDCYTVVRKWYWQNRGVKLRDVPRDVEWWKNGDDLYSKFEQFGFREIPESEAKIGDAVLGHWRSKNILNHAGIIYGRDQLLHHIDNRLSARVVYGQWHRFIRHWLRYEG